MLHGTLWDKIPRFAVPVAATAILSQLFNAADIAVIGNFTGELRTVAVAAVGTNSSIISLIVNLFIGIALGANVTIAHAIGEKNDTMVHHAVHTSIVVAVLGGLIAAVIGELFAVPLLNQLNVPDDVFPLALLYLRIYLAGLPVILLYNFEAAVFRSVGETKIPLIALTASGVLNVILNLFFVAVLHMSVDGVAIATVLSNAVSAAILWVFLLKTDKVIRLEPKSCASTGCASSKFCASAFLRVCRARCSPSRISSFRARSTASARSSWRRRARPTTLRSSPTISSTPSRRPARHSSDRTSARARSSAARKRCCCVFSRASSASASPSL